MKIYELHIENLVMHGIDPADRYLVGDAVQRELTRLLAGADAAAAITRSVEISDLDAGAFTLQPGATSEGIGVQLARTIHSNLSTNPKRTTQS